jgi:AraC-like DNA-binding protein
MDVLSDVLRTVHLQSAIHFCPELTAPWGISVPAQTDRAVFYFLSRGSGYLESDAIHSPVPLAGGDLIMLPHGDAHKLRDRLESSVVPLDSVMEGACRSGPAPTAQHGGGGEKSSLVAGYFIFEDRAANHLLSTLPSLMYIPSEEGCTVPWLDATLRFLASESNSKVPGADIVLNRLADVLFIQIVRTHIARYGKLGKECQEKAGVLRALIDPNMGKALEAIHEHPEHPWTVVDLASRAGMSRTAFAVRFSSVAGIGPLYYVRKWRMLKAADLLRHSEASVEDVAGRVGYESGAAFRKAFHREMGIPPALYRKKLNSFAGPQPI